MQQLTAHARSFENRCAERGEEFRRLGAGQSPQALFVTCSDSRVVPALITGAAPGDLFELRTAGNIVPEYRPERPAGEAATIEYAVQVLGVEHIVVCGHSHCGAVGALVRGEDLTGVPAVRGWLESAAPELPGGGADGGTPELADAVQRHALAQAERLRSYPCVAEGLDAGRLSLDVWFYEVHTGAVRRHRPETGRFESL
ncbi:carbonic anhydrase [Streptomyces sp. SID8375]|uniref:carbonic anhydrase n=1 Tax=unclassified Streptomyces TaxID=2593676 RepID=UPI000379C03C|nr:MULTISPECIES: carbonic anhydrase [unclassified Streptomyces]MYX10982.1 carbonic anhydrase [Streptomyces sp. SID8375]